jgi:hypothetical protein
MENQSRSNIKTKTLRDLISLSKERIVQHENLSLSNFPIPLTNIYLKTKPLPIPTENYQMNSLISLMI